MRRVFESESPVILRVGLVSDIHWGGPTGREELPDGELLKAKLELFTARMNSWKADFVVQLGDIADSWTATFDPDAPLVDRLCSEEVMVDRLTEARDFLDNRLTMPIYHVWGNHEMKNPAWGYDRVLEPLGFKTLEDTWYTFEKNGLTFIVMNTAHKEVIRNHIIPEEELAWLQQTLVQTINPTFIFFHVPITEAGTGPKELVYDKYDYALNEERARALIEADGEVVAAFFGHMHHADAWDRIRTQVVNGVTYYHITSPHVLMDDDSETPWGELTIYEGWYMLRASYKSEEYPTEWTGRFQPSFTPAPSEGSSDLGTERGQREDQ